MVQPIDGMIDLTANLFMRRPPAKRRGRGAEIHDAFGPLWEQMCAFEARLIAVMFLLSIAQVVVVTVILWAFFRT